MNHTFVSITKVRTVAHPIQTVALKKNIEEPASHLLRYSNLDATQQRCPASLALLPLRLPP